MLHKTTHFSRLMIALTVSLAWSLGVNALSFFTFKKNIQQHLLDNNPYVRSSVESKKNRQVLEYTAVALHHRSCRQAMQVIGQYEQFQNHIDFINRSSYQQGRINLGLSSIFLPFDMTLNFKIPRIHEPGTYPFLFDNGFLKGLNGVIHVQKFDQKKFKCLIGLTASWSGPETKIPDTVFEIFTKTIGQIGLTKLFRISGHRF